MRTMSRVNNFSIHIITRKLISTERTNTVSTVTEEFLLHLRFLIIRPTINKPRGTLFAPIGSEGA